MGRMVNILIFFTLFVYIIDKRNRNLFSTMDMLKSYLIGCYILLFFGILQLLNVLFGLPYPDWHTRSSIHSMDISGLLPFMTIRITSIANEPAFLIPYLIDAIILLFYTSKKYISILLFLIVIFFSLSLSGYLNVLFIGIVFFCYMRKSPKKIITGFFLIVFVFCVGYQLRGVFSSVFNRLTPSNLFSSGRFQTIILSVKYMFSDISLFNTLFGFGPKSFEYVRRFVSYTSGYLQGIPIETTAHFIFIDFLVEHGIVGMITVIVLFYYLFRIGKKAYKKTENRLSQVLCLNLFFTSLYTADFASPRFTIIIVFILCLYKDTI
jgi:hypothetical protein